MLKRILVSTIILVISLAAGASEIQVHKEIQPPTLSYWDGYHHFTSAPGPVWGEPGSPELPYVGHQLLLPPGEEITSVRVENPIWAVLPGQYLLFPAQPPIPFSRAGQPAFTPPNAAIYSSASLYPTGVIQMFRTDFLCGHGLGALAIWTARYQPVSGQLEVLVSYDLILETGSTSRAQSAVTGMLRQNSRVLERLAKLVDNFEAISAYGTPDEIDETFVDYLIITAGQYAPTFQTLADHYTARGLQAEIKTLEEIQAQYTGIDLADKIRNCIIDYYVNEWVQYVLLGGDTDFLPKRGLFAQVGGEIDEDIASDLYFSNLDGNWNTDGDNRWGEPNEADMYSEVAIGRMSVDSQAEAINMINKTMCYENVPVGSEIERALMVGEDLGWTVWGSEIKEEVRLGSTAIYTSAGFPANFTVGTMYDTPSFSFNAMSNLLPLLNLGPNFVNHMGHGDVGWVMKFATGQITDINFTNNGLNHNFFIAYSQACYSGSFDNRTVSGSYTSDCIAEAFTTISHAAVAFVANSRYGWGYDNNTNGPSQYYDRQFFDAIFGENIYNLGWINADSKEDNVPYLGSATYWCYYETNLMGDPALEVWTGLPLTYSPSYPEAILLGWTEFEVNVGEPDATVTLAGSTGIMGIGTSGASGVAIVAIVDPIQAPGDFTLTVTGHNYLPYVDVVPAVAANGPFIILQNPSFDDLQGGDGDGNAELGESLLLSMSFQNVGTEIGEGLTATLQCLDNCVQIDQGSVALGDLDVNATIDVEDAFQVTVLPTVSNEQVLNFLITVQDSHDSTWENDYLVTAHAPSLQLVSWQAVDGNNNWLTPGESATLEIELCNSGAMETTDLTLWLNTDNPSVNVTNPSSTMLALTPGDSGSAGNLQFELDPGMIDPSALILYVTATDTRNYQKCFLIEAPVGGFWDNMESGEGDWTHTNVSPAFGDQWNMSQTANHTPGGSHSWYCGLNNQYAASLDAGLTTGEVTLSGQHELRFYHWMSAELSTSYPGYAYDGGIVEMSLDGQPYQQITPRGGYPYHIRQGSVPGPFAPETPCYSGTIVWGYAIFDLEGEGTARFRFRFGSDGAVSSVGWFVDDVQIVKVSNPAAPTNLTSAIAGAEVTLTWNTPGLDLGAAGLSGKDWEGDREGESLEYYNVYRNMAKVDSLAALAYVDNLNGLPLGTYTYQVSGVFGGIEGPLSQPVLVDYLLSANQQNPPYLPEKTSLRCAYPNPFNPVIHLGFDLAQPGTVELTVYDLLGRAIETLVKGSLAAGRHEIAWDASARPSGLYLVQMKTEAYEGIQKVMLVK